MSVQQPKNDDFETQQNGVKNKGLGECLTISIEIDA